MQEIIKSCSLMALLGLLVSGVSSSPLYNDYASYFPSSQEDGLDSDYYGGGGSNFNMDDYLFTSLYPEDTGFSDSDLLTPTFYTDTGLNTLEEEPEIDDEFLGVDIDPSEIETLYRNILSQDLDIDAEELPWYSNTVENPDTFVWPEQSGSSMTGDNIFLRNGHADQQDDAIDQLHMALKEKRNSETLESYQLSKDPMISFRKPAHSNSSPVSSSSSTTTPASIEASTRLSAEKRGMLEVAILRPESASDPKYRAKRSVADSIVRGAKKAQREHKRAKRALRAPEPYVRANAGSRHNNNLKMKL